MSARLAGAGFKAARRAAEAGRCQTAEFLFAVGGGSLKATTTRTKSLSGVKEALDAATDGTRAAEAISQCWVRQAVQEEKSS
ncbi:MAG TPA: hypothetical protein VHO06_26650 [Polyangia bacterium]|nr:hypothetical protein [Polyangia bacterium]